MRPWAERNEPISQILNMNNCSHNTMECSCSVSLQPD
uniref:Uncharacterized protein n=1 Tax=Anguilla anguilla TaxID=7936 RepID=A0A0E9W533_ANGAN